MLKLNVLVAGSTGYIGVQLIKLLVKHKYINIKYLCGNSSVGKHVKFYDKSLSCLLYTSPSPRDLSTSRMPSSA